MREPDDKRAERIAAIRETARRKDELAREPAPAAPGRRRHRALPNHVEDDEVAPREIAADMPIPNSTFEI